MECLDLCCELECEFIELNMSLPWCQLAALVDGPLPRECDTRGKGLTLHLPEDVDVCHFTPAVAEAWKRTTLDVVRWAVCHDTPIVTMHMPRGIYFTLPGRKLYLYEQYRDHYAAALARLRDDCARIIGKSPTSVCVEHSDFNTGFLREGVETLLESPCFGLTWDIGHSASAGYADRPFHEKHIDRVRHFHIHDHTHDAQGHHNHLPWGAGDVDISAWLALAERHHCRVVVETKTIAALRQSMRWINA